MHLKVDDRLFHIHHDGDWSGDAIIIEVDKFGGEIQRIELPGPLLAACSWSAANDAVISLIEQMDGPAGVEFDP